MNRADRQAYYDALFSPPSLKGIEYDAETDSITIGDGPIFEKLWARFMEEERKRRAEESSA